MGRVIWSPSALEDADAIAAFIARDSVDRAALFITRLFEAADRIASFPQAGRIIPELSDNVRREKGPRLVQISDSGPIVSGDIVVFIPLGVDELPAVHEVEISGASADPTQPWKTMILDEALGLFDLAHRGRGAARVSSGADPNTGSTLLAFENASNGGHATLATNYLRQVRGGSINYQKDWGIDLAIVDPCAGQPPPCNSLDGGVLSSSARVRGSDDEVKRATVNVSDPSGRGANAPIHIDADFSEFGYAALDVEILSGNVVVGTLLQHSGVVVAESKSPDRWPSGVRWNMSMAVNRLAATVQFTGPQQFDFGTVVHSGDALRFFSPTVPGIIYHELTTVNIPEVLITDVAFEHQPNPPCPADIAPPGGNGVVNVSDLLAVINSWGPCPAPCPPGCAADIVPNCVVNVSDLLAVINAWGPCR